MNVVNLIGRLTKDPVMRKTQSDIAVTSFTIAVNRRFKNQDGEYEADFIQCVAWRKTGELVEKHFEKGSQIGVTGSWQTRTYDKDGTVVYVSECVVESITFIDSKHDRDESKEQPREQPKKDKPISEDDLPF